MAGPGAEGCGHEATGTREPPPASETGWKPTGLPQALTACQEVRKMLHKALRSSAFKQRLCFVDLSLLDLGISPLSIPSLVAETFIMLIEMFNLPGPSAAMAHHKQH